MDILIRQNAIERIDKPETPTTQTDSGCETSTTKSSEEILTSTITTIETIQTNDIIILGRDPDTNKRYINKTAYAKLHRSLSPTRQLDSIKSKYETSENECDNDDDSSKLHRSPAVRLSKQDLEVIRNKTKLPVAKPRSSIKSEVILPTQKLSQASKHRHSLILDRKSKKRDENSNEVFRKSSSSSGEFITVIPRSESVETVDKLEKELNLFTMDKKHKDKKRANSFRKIFTGKIFSKEKKKKEETENIQQKKNVTDNIRNENAFSRQSPHRHSLGSTNIPKPTRLPQPEDRRMPIVNIEELEKKYAQMHVNEFNSIKHNFENPDSPVDSSKHVPTVNPGPMDFKKVANIKKFIDTSSSASTMESDRDNSINSSHPEGETSYKSIRFSDNHRNTPPRAQELRQIQDVRLVNPKALIPINSERPLPNPYQNIASSKPTITPKPHIVHQDLVNSSPKPKVRTQFSFNESETKVSYPVVEETYGTVFDSLELKKEAPNPNSGVKIVQKPPRSPSLEPSKLKLPPNRDVGPMTPRMRSPIPQHHVSAEKLIATELLRGSRSPTPTKKKTNQLSSSHQRLEMNIDYPDNVSAQRSDNQRVVTSKPPISRIPEQIRSNQLSPSYENRSSFDSQERLNIARPSEYVNVQKTTTKNQFSTFTGSQERLLDSRSPEQLRRNSPISPNYENRNQIGSIEKRTKEHTVNHQISPNYNNRTQMVTFVGSQEKVPLRTPDHMINIQQSPNYENRNQMATFTVSQEKIPYRLLEQMTGNQENRNQMGTFIVSQEKVPSRLSEQLVSNQASPNYENRNQMGTFIVSQEKRPLRIAEQISPNYENRGQLGTFVVPQDKVHQISPNYETKNQFVGSQERVSRPRTPDHINLQRRSQVSPIYDARVRLGSQEQLLSSTVRSPTPNSLLQNPELSSIRPQSSRSSTPVEMRIPQQSKQSPQKEEMRRSVEAYYWKEIKKLKEQENRDLYFYQMQMLPFGFAEDPVSFRRSRSSSPSHRNGRRSLSLPREPKSQPPITEVDSYGRFQPTPIPEGRAVVNYPNYYQQNFRRNVPERRTIDAAPRNDNVIYRPIFKRGSLTTPVRELVEDQQYKKVSFSNGQEDVWPTKNGFTQSPPQRRSEAKRHESVDDEVFLPNPQQTTKLIVDGKEIYGYTNRPNQMIRTQEPHHYQNANFYKQIHQEPVYGSRVPVRETIQEDPRLTRYNSIQLTEPTYGQHQRVSRRMSFDNSQTFIPKPPQMQQHAPRRQIYVKDEIYGYFGGYIPGDQQNIVYTSKQNIPEPLYDYNRGGNRQVTVRDKVCDMYGQIHDRNSPSTNVRKSGVILGQIQPSQAPSYNNPPPPQNFVRNSRLTASANDMYKRYPNMIPRYGNNVIYDRYRTQNEAAPSRPLPPVPTEKKVYFRQPNANDHSTMDLNDVQQTNSIGKNKKRAGCGQPPQIPTLNNNNESKSTTSNLPRIILLEQLQLIRRQKELELNKWQWQLNQNESENKEYEYRRLQLESRSTEDLSVSDLRKLVLIEELQLVKLKIRLELDKMK